MGRDKAGREKRKRHHSHQSRSQDESDSSDEESSSDYDSDSSVSSSSDSSETGSSEEERRRRKRKKARRSSKGEKKRRGSKIMKKLRKGKSKKKHLEGSNEISLDDYYLRSAEFRTWLSKERKVFFSDLTSDQSRALFKKFVSKWNSGSLDKSYYRGIQSSDVGHGTQSNYQWKFSSGVSSSDLQTVRDSVSSWSSSKTSLGSATSTADPSGSRGTTASAGSRGTTASASSKGMTTSADSGHSSTIGPLPAPKGPPRMIGPSMGPSGSGPGQEDVYEREEMRESERARMKKERRDFRKQQELVMDELVPKATGREAKLEKKKVRAEKRRDRDVSPALEESSVYGTSYSGIRNKVKARQEQRQNKAEAAVQRISDYKAKEKARVEAILEMAKAHKKEGALW